MIDHQGSRGSKPSRLDHVGIVVDDLEDAKLFVGGVLGLEMTNEVSIAPAKMRAAYFRCDEVEVDLLGLSDPVARRARLGAGLKANIEHLVLEVDSPESAITDLDARGVGTTHPQPVLGGLGARTDPTTSNGIRFQLIQKDHADCQLMPTLRSVRAIS